MPEEAVEGGCTMPEEPVVDPGPGPFAAGDLAYCTAGNGIHVKAHERQEQVRIPYGDEVTVVGPSKTGNLRTTHVSVLFGTGVRPRSADVPISQVWTAAAWLHMERALTLVHTADPLHFSDVARQPLSSRGAPALY